MTTRFGGVDGDAPVERIVNANANRIEVLLVEHFPVVGIDSRIVGITEVRCCGLVDVGDGDDIGGWHGSKLRGMMLTPVAGTDDADPACHER